MAQEIEYKYLVDLDKIGPDLMGNTPKRIVQGYLSLDPYRTIRVRMEFRGDNCIWSGITIKGKTEITESGARSCKEFNWPIPLEDAEELIEMAQGFLITKLRYLIIHANHIWEVDFFAGVHDGLVVAECEIEEGEEVILPSWVTVNVSDKEEYVNAYLAKRKYDGKSDQG